MKNAIWYGVLCETRRGKGPYVRYFTTFASDPLSLEDIKEKAYPAAVNVFYGNSRRAVSEQIKPYRKRRDPPQPELFDE